MLKEVVRDRGFVILYVTILTLSVALFTPFVFIKSYATDHGIADSQAAALVGIIGASSVVGRLGLGGLGARLGATRLTQISFVVLTASFLIWLAAGDSYAMLVAFADRDGRRLRRLHRPHARPSPPGCSAPSASAPCSARCTRRPASAASSARR